MSTALRAIGARKTVYAPALWEVEFRIFDLLAERTGISQALIYHDSRLIEDLNIDSLELVELILVLEEEFAVSIPDEAARSLFLTPSTTARDLADLVRQRWGKGTANRRRWLEHTQAPTRPLKMAFTQLGSSITEEHWRAGELYQPLGPNDHGHAQFRRRTDGMRCILLPAATVELGSDAPDALYDQRPQHRARLSSFLIDAEPVSTTAFARFLNSVAAPTNLVFEWCGVLDDDRRSPHFQLDKQNGQWLPLPGTERQPMVLVSWFGAAAYSLWANRDDWRAYKTKSLLPSEAQWEYAGRGPNIAAFPWGDSPPTPSHATIGLHRARSQYGALPLADVTARVGVSPFGVLHMAGNVWNWCADWYTPDFYTSSQAGRANPLNSHPTGLRSERGGSWVGPAELAKSSYRRGRPPHARCRALGFRCIGLVSNLP